MGQILGLPSRHGAVSPHPGVTREEKRRVERSHLPFRRRAPRNCRVCRHSLVRCRPGRSLGYANREPNRDAHDYANRDTHTNRDSHGYANSRAHGYANSDADTNRDPHGYANRDTNRCRSVVCSHRR